MEKVARICLIGPESTGKTELAAALAAHYRAVWVPEYSREYALGRNNQLTYADVEPIARGQIAAEDRGAAEASGMIVLDTDLLSTVVYSRHYYGKVPSWIESEARRRRAGLYLLMDVDLPWIADPARDRGEARADLFREFESALQEFDARFEKLGGTKDRLQNAIRAIERWSDTSS